MAVVPIFYSYNCSCNGSGPRWEWSTIYEAVDPTFTVTSGDLTPRITFLTSHIYPLEIIDAIDARLGLINQRLLTTNIDQVDATFRLVAGALDVVAGYAAYVMDDEAVDASFQLLYGALGVISGTEVYVTDDEAVETSFVLQSGTLVVVAGYVDHTITAEAVETNFTLTGGTLL